MSYCRTLSVLSCTILFAASACTPDQPGVPLERAEADLRFLSNDLLEGRGTPSRGLDIAALYLANQLRAAGWTPPANGDYLQPYEVGVFNPAAAEIQVSINGIPLEESQYIFVSFGLRPEETPVEYDMVMAGYGVSIPEREVDDFHDLDVAGKAVVAFNGAPWELEPNTMQAPDRSGGKGTGAALRGADMFLYVTEEFSPEFPGTPDPEVDFLNNYAQVTLTQLIENPKTAAFTVPFLVLGPEGFDQTLAEKAGGTYAEIQARLATGEFVAAEIPATIRIEVNVENVRGLASNVVATLPGTDSELRDEWVILTAHYDHLGAYDAPPGEDGIFNGADDNASGTAAVLEVARRLAASGELKRSVAVAFFSGEEMGLLGSAHYSEHPPVPIDQTVLCINVDGVGRSEGTVEALTPGSEELERTAIRLGRGLGFRVLPDQQPNVHWIYYLDSYHFAKQDVPSISFSAAGNDDYHQPSDEVGKIRFEEFNQIVDVIEALAKHYAGGSALPTYARPRWFLMR